MAWPERLGDLIKAERESLADLSHRLRTPLTSLRLQSEGLNDADERQLLTDAVDRMQEAVDGMILEVRRGKDHTPRQSTSRRLFRSGWSSGRSSPRNRSEKFPVGGRAAR